jgi:hypothetical protein
MTSSPTLSRGNLQLWLTFTWPDPAEPVAVGCTACGWRGRRRRQRSTARPCFRCGEAVYRRGE